MTGGGIGGQLEATTTDLATAEAPEVGRALTGIGLNLLTRDVAAEAAFLVDVLGMTLLRGNADFALLRYGGHVLQLHADHTYHSNPLPSLLPEVGPRGGGAELRAFETDPDQAAEKAAGAGYMILQPPQAKPHGLRECFILSPDGYCWVPSRPLAPDEG